MQHVSSFGGPRILLPTRDAERWMREIGDNPSSDSGLYGLACSVGGYCGIIRPWDTPFIVFGDDPSDIYWLPDDKGGLFVRWVGAESLGQLLAFANAVLESNIWTEQIAWEAPAGVYTLMDTCTFEGDKSSKIEMDLGAGMYVLKSVYAESEEVMTIVHHLEYLT